MKDTFNKTSGLINYERQGSNSNNYGISPTSSSPESFTAIMDNGVIVEYKNLFVSSINHKIESK